MKQGQQNTFSFELLRGTNTQKVKTTANDKAKTTITVLYGYGSNEIYILDGSINKYMFQDE